METVPVPALKKDLMFPIRSLAQVNNNTIICSKISNIIKESFCSNNTPVVVSLKNRSRYKSSIN
jgi:hypothetical protein